MPTVLELADRFKQALDRRDLAELNRIVNAYAGIQKRLQGEIDALFLEIGDTLPSREQVRRMERFQRLMADTEAELDKFTRFMEVELETTGRAMVNRGLMESRALMRAAVGDVGEVVAGFRDLPPEAVERLLGFLDPSGPLMKRVKLLAPHTMELFRNAILENVALGRNPRAWAREVTKALGVGLSDSLRMARTVQLYSYREASRANYVANSDVVRGWQWYAKLDGLTCLSCVSQHGKIFSVDQSLNDHHNGRCTMLPITPLSPNGHIDQNAGQAWFEGLSEAEQKKMMGSGRFDAWKGGRFGFDQLSREHEDEVYGLMRSETPLKELVKGD